MSKKRQIKKIFDSTSIESADAQPRLTESIQGEGEGEATPPVTHPQAEVIEASSSDEGTAREKPPLSDEPNVEGTESVPVNLQNEATASNLPEEGMETPSGQEPSSGETPLISTSAQGPSAEDLLEDVRQSLIEEDSDKQKKESKWWRRIGKKGKRVEPDQPSETIEIDLPAMLTSPDVVEDHEAEPALEESVDEIDELIDMLAEAEAAPSESTVAPEVQAPTQPEPEIDFEKLKEQAFQPRTPDDEPESDVRSVALEDGEEVFVEVQSQVPDTLGERVNAFENALRPYRWYINIALAFFGVVVVVLVSLIMFNVYQQSRPQPTQVSNLPYPASVSLPGGWSFQLGRGTLQNGRWDPQGAEWLEGTEICRWVALPWTRQLEAVVRTLNPKDPVELVMSNNDKLVYEVYSIQQLTLEEIQALDSNSPCLLLILTQSDTEERWVLTALP